MELGLGRKAIVDPKRQLKRNERSPACREVLPRMRFPTLPLGLVSATPFPQADFSQK